MNFFEDSDILESVKATANKVFTKRDEKKKIRTKEQLAELEKEAQIFFKQQLQKELIDREAFYNDGDYQITYFSVDKEDLYKKTDVEKKHPWNAPKYMDKEKRPDELTLPVLFPLFESRINVKFDKSLLFSKEKEMAGIDAPIRRGKTILARGEGWYQYSLLAKPKPYLFEDEFLKLVGASVIEDVDKALYKKYPGFRIYQIIRVK